MSEQNENQVPPEEIDLFHHGVITKLFPSNDMGLIRTEGGREVPFSFQLVVLLGKDTKPNELKEGEKVGYDLGWTSHGLRVIKIKTYPDSLSGEPPSGLKR
ncbi:MAG: hypothetical protein ACE5HC_01920 [Candidatus Binatia bacterium]